MRLSSKTESLPVSNYTIAESKTQSELWRVVFGASQIFLIIYVELIDKNAIGWYTRVDAGVVQAIWQVNLDKTARM